MKTKTFIGNFVRKFICWVLLIQLINLSTDPVDQINFKNGYATFEEDLSINEIESFYELVLEDFFHKNVPESDENDGDAFIKVFDLYCSAGAVIEMKPEIIHFPPIIYSTFYQDSFCTNYPEINSPPPKKA